MIAVECPQCGAPTPAFPLTPDRVACRACKYVGPPRPEVLEQLRASAHHVGVTNAQHARQLGATQLAAQTSLIKNRTRLHILLVLLLFPGLIFLVLLGFSVASDDPFYTVTVYTGVPLLLFALAIFFGSRTLDRQVRELADACGAIPPATAGGAAQCHLCGADLPPASSASPICRCHHCGADNVASPELMRDVLAKRHWEVGHFDRSLAQRGVFLAKRGASAVALVIGLAAIAPFVGCVGGLALEFALEDVEVARARNEYVLIDFEGDICVAAVQDKNAEGGWKLQSGIAGAESFQTVREPGRFTRVDDRWFVGRVMKKGPGEQTIKGPVKRVFTTVLRPKRNKLRIDVAAPGRDFTGLIEDRCLVERPKDVVAYPWPRSTPAPVPSASTAASGSTAASPGSQSPLAPTPTAPKGRGR